MFKLFKLKFSNRFFSLNKDYTKIDYFLKDNNLIKNHNYINGERVGGEPSNLFEDLNPATGRLMAQIESPSLSQINDCVEIANNAQKLWRRVSLHEKMKIMRNAASLVRLKANKLATIEVLDTGKPFWEAKADIYACADTIDMYGSFLYSCHGSHVSLSENNFYYTHREPLGVCVGIGAWNFPFQMACWKSAPAIAAGNSFIFKPSPLSPLSAILLAEIFQESGVPKGLFSIIQGGSDIGNILCKHPNISKISFTGSVPTGKKIMKSSVDTLKRTTLELGGKSPLIIFEDASIEESIKGILLANFLTQGEVCSNGTRVYIHSSIYDKFEKGLIEAMDYLKIGDPFDPSVAVGAIISESHFNLIMEFIDSAKNCGCDILYGGNQLKFPKESYLSGGFYIVPCVIGNCSDDMKIVREEIFGPVVTILKFDTEKEVIARANDSVFGLAGGLFTKQLDRAHRVAAQLECGTVYVNTYNSYPPGMPFGGYKLSGIGKENCQETLDCYSQIKSVFVETSPIQYPFWPNKTKLVY